VRHKKRPWSIDPGRKNIHFSSSTDKSAPLGVVVAGLEVIEFCFFAGSMAVGPFLGHHSSTEIALKSSTLHAHYGHFTGGQEDNPLALDRKIHVAFLVAAIEENCHLLSFCLLCVINGT
jgi:hypothetical protein